MYITLEADYAVRIVACLIKKNRRIDAKSISQEACVTLRFSLKILGKLVSAGLVKSYKGTSGGYEMAKAADEISLCDVIEIIEGTYCFSRCLIDDELCTRKKSKCCCFQKAFRELSDSIRENLKSYTFDKLLASQAE